MMTIKQSNLVLPPISSILPPQYFSNDMIAQPPSPSQSCPSPSASTSIAYLNVNQFNSPEQYSNLTQRYTTNNATYNISSNNSSSGSTYSVTNFVSADEQQGLDPNTVSRRGSAFNNDLNGMTAGRVHTLGQYNGSYNSVSLSHPQIPSAMVQSSPPTALSTIVPTRRNSMYQLPPPPTPPSIHASHQPTYQEHIQNHNQQDNHHHLHHHHNGHTLSGKGNRSIGRSHVCEQCGKQFTRPSALRTHMLVHSGAKPFKCTWDDCNKTFDVKSNLIRHLKLHKERSSKVPSQSPK